MKKTDIPAWPSMMKRSTAAAYLDMSEAAFEREIIGGRMPAPITFGGRPHWRKDAIDAAIAALDRTSDIPAWQKEFEERYGKVA